MPVLARHFSHPAPLFRRTRSPHGVPWRESVYFLWFEALRRHAGYRRECERGGGGKYARLFADFGDVHAKDFRKWWREGDRGARLFAEPPAVNSVQVLRPSDLEELRKGWDEKSTMVLAIPLAFSKRDIARRVAELVARACRRGRGERLSGSSKARYPVASHFNLHSLRTALRTYDLRRARPEMRLWEIAEEVSLGARLTEAERRAPRGDPSAVIARVRLAVAASRKLKAARRLIEGVGKGVFPAMGSY